MICEVRPLAAGYQQIPPWSHFNFMVLNQSQPPFSASSPCSDEPDTFANKEPAKLRLSPSILARWFVKSQAEIVQRCLGGLR